VSDDAGRALGAVLVDLAGCGVEIEEDAIKASKASARWWLISGGSRKAAACQHAGGPLAGRDLLLNNCIHRRDRCSYQA